MRYATSLPELLEGKKLRPFKPSCFYLKELDWLVYLNRDCSYVACRSDREEVELLMDGEDVVGFKVLNFLTLPRSTRFEYLYATGLAPDDIKGVESIMLHNVDELLPEIEASETEFFQEFRRRKALGLITD